MILAKNHVEFKAVGNKIYFGDLHIATIPTRDFDGLMVNSDDSPVNCNDLAECIADTLDVWFARYYD
jgi:hypothetical protein